MEIQLFFLTLCLSIIPCHLQWPGIFNRGRAQKRPPIDGHWSSWESWSSCYKNTNNPATSSPYFSPWDGFNVRSRNRSCTNPRPLFGGQECDPPNHRFKQCSCSNPLLGQSRLESSRLTASSFLPGYPPSEVRLNNATSAGWCAQQKTSFFTETYLQIDFENFVSVGAIATISNAKGRVYRYKLKYSLDGTTWKSIRKDKKSVLTGNYFPNKLQKNTFSSRVMRYLKLITVSHFELPCLKMEVYGCLFTCGKRLTAPFGELTARSSPLYDQNCLWKIDVANTKSLTFSFNQFYVTCEDGYVNFYSGHSQFSKAKLMKQVCQQGGSSGIPKLKLDFNSVWVKFVSNSSEEEVNFNIKYFSKCSRVIRLQGGVPVVITSPNYPEQYVNNLNCNWEIISPSSSNKIEITPNEFNVEGGSTNGQQCTSDVVTIDTDQNVNVGSFCNDNKPTTMVIVAQKVVITFKSDSITTEKGFKFTIKSGSSNPVPRAATNAQAQNVDVSRSANELRISDPNAPSGGRYNTTGKQKVKTEKDETWTVIVICTFSALVIVLIGTVMYMNCKRWIDNRNDLNAQCRKVAAEEQRKGKNKSNERNVLIGATKAEERYSRPPEHQVLLNKPVITEMEGGSSTEEAPEAQLTEPTEEQTSDDVASTVASDPSPLPDEVDPDVVDGEGGESSGSEAPTSSSPDSEELTSVPETEVVSSNSESPSSDDRETVM